MKSKAPAALLAVLVVLAAAPALLGADAKALGAAVDRLLDHKALAEATVGVEIRSLTTGEVVYSRNARTRLIVASNNKLVTTASALFHLGGDFRFETRLFGRGRVDGGILEGDLVVKGGGDPCLCERFHPGDPLEPLKALAAGVREAGITRITGDLVLDDLVFDREWVAPGWPRGQLCYYYCAPVSGLSLMENVLGVTVQPAASVGAAARVALFPPAAPFSIAGTIETVERNDRNVIHIERPDADGTLAVRGQIPRSETPWEGKVALTSPPLFFGDMLRLALRDAGVGVDGRTVLAERPVDCGGPECRVLSSVSSPLAEAVIVTNKESHNNFAEHLFKAAGWKLDGVGSFETGADAVAALIDRLGIEDADPFTIVDGSGLSRENRFSAHTLVSLLRGMYFTPFRDTYIRSLPVSGEDGSLEKRLTEEAYRRNVRAKTGWIREVSALSGYIQARSGDVFAFSILFNGYEGLNAPMKKVQDDICRAVVDMD